MIMVIVIVIVVIMVVIVALAMRMAVMIVTMMVVVMMVMAVPFVIVVMAMIMGARRRRTMIMIVVIFIMAGARPVVVAMHAAMAIGATFRIECGLDRRDHGPETLQHRLDDMIAADAQPVAEQFRRQMAIAEMPGDADEMGRITCRHLGERLRRRRDGDDATILQHQPVAMAQRDRTRQVEQERCAADSRHRDAPAMPRIEIEQHGIRSFFRPEAGGIDGNSADHAGRSW